MKTVCKKEYCAGCMACESVCPQNAVEVVQDIEFNYAEIDEEKCINCNLCEKVCQVFNPPELTKPIFWKQGWADQERATSSSGGVASALSVGFIEKCGIVYSCSFKDGAFVFIRLNEVQDVCKVKGSKYVKSEPHDVYIQIKNDLENNLKVLFIGLPCQVAAVKKCISEKFQNQLYTVDLICHGSPSPKVLDLFLKQYDLSLGTIQDISFRNKVSFGLKSSYHSIGVQGVRDAYTIGFLNGISYTENCYQCKYAQFSRVGDISLGDSWNSDLPMVEQNKGLSLILCQSVKGKEMINWAQLDLNDVDIEKAIQANHQLQTPSIRPRERDNFIASIKKGKKFNIIIWSCYPKQSIRQLVKKILIKCHIKKWGG